MKIKDSINSQVIMPITIIILLGIVLVTFNNCGQSSQGEGGNDLTSEAINNSSVPRSLNCSPDFGLLEGNERIECSIPNNQIFIGANVSIKGESCYDLVIEGGHKFFCNVPEQSEAGLVDIVITNPSGSSFRIANGFGYHDCWNYDKEQSRSDSLLFGESRVLQSFCGVPPYNYKIISGSGTISQISKIYTASTIEEEAIVKQVDSVGNENIYYIDIIPPPLLVSSARTNYYPGEAIILKVEGGTPPYNFYASNEDIIIINDQIRLNENADNGSAVINVSDSKGRTSNFNFSISSLILSPSMNQVTLDKSVTLSTVGGNTPYVYMIESGEGEIVGDLLTFSAEGEVVITVTDSLGASASTSIEVYKNLNIDQNLETKVNIPLNIVPLGGVPPVKFEIETGIGGVDGQGAFNSSIPGTAEVLVSDKIGNSKLIALIIHSDLNVSYSDSMKEISSQTISTSGGLSPYSYRVIEGNGTIDGSVLSSTTMENVVVEVEDSLGYKKTISIQKVEQPPFTINMSNGMCSTASCYVEASGGVPPYYFTIIEEYSSNSAYQSGHCLAVSGSGLLMRTSNWYPENCKYAKGRVSDSNGNVIHFQVSPVRFLERIGIKLDHTY